MNGQDSPGGVRAEPDGVVAAPGCEYAEGAEGPDEIRIRDVGTTLLICAGLLVVSALMVVVLRVPDSQDLDRSPRVLAAPAARLEH